MPDANLADNSRNGDEVAETRLENAQLWGKRTAVGAGVALAAILGTGTAASAATTHQYAYYGNQTKIYGEVWFNSGACCIPQRNSFTVKDRVADGTRIKVYWSGARTGNYTLPDGAGNEETFSIESNNVARAVIHWKACTLVSGGVEWCNNLMNDYID
ncbi:hypothetical protein C5N14_07060 [Micromonospora sp. MW-13]|uniref:hypothetical protein n=1 Tax=Micromonospora sp. MW-13 TaxID=2094022 RepID=UPI000ED6C36C|nr:hypothetical protein [Micromonospora sp. MW-13]RGC70171.1 hypothetical protein C5N14_07060 [Micromonospora sp. MW-13]